ncbi:hypothetical protein FGO68_gene8244 [Halteria grandinella]|uniref:Uncharacterized protein n=1 Tax=Halteria grandinella TaxID=5974 RepID=A0A8J8T0S5_HALGN|nr:hypothetical protein FGO68_gene8244 [Halteria grandinella]
MEFGIQVTADCNVRAQILAQLISLSQLSSHHFEARGALSSRLLELYTIHPLGTLDTDECAFLSLHASCGTVQLLTLRPSFDDVFRSTYSYTLGNLWISFKKPVLPSRAGAAMHRRA